MPLGRVYLWTRDPDRPLGGSIAAGLAPLVRLEEGDPDGGWLQGRYVHVKNAGWVNAPDPLAKLPRAVPIGNGRPDEHGDFVFEQGRGGGRMDKVELADPDFRWRCRPAKYCTTAADCGNSAG